MTLYPVNLNIHDQVCLVIGGGVVAKRKVEALIACRPRIVLISPELCEGLAIFAEKNQIEWKQRDFQSGDLKGAKLVFAATDNRVTQQKIAEEADRAGILVNVVTDPESCSFQVPAMFRQGNLLITVATGGASPALAALIRKELEMEYGKEYRVLLTLMALVRRQIVGVDDDQAQHKLLFEKLLNSDILLAIKTADWTQLRITLERILPSQIEAAKLVNTLQTQESESMEALSC